MNVLPGSEQTRNQLTTEGVALAERLTEEESMKLMVNVRKHVLDPIMSFAQLLTEHSVSTHEDHDFTTEETGAILRLLVLGGYAELRVFGCALAAPCDYADSDYFEMIDRHWARISERMKGGEA